MGREFGALGGRVGELLATWWGEGAGITDTQVSKHLWQISNILQYLLTTPFRRVYCCEPMGEITYGVEGWVGTFEVGWADAH